MNLGETQEIKLKAYIQGSLSDIQNAIFEYGNVDVEPAFATTNRICHYCTKHLGVRSVRLIVSIEYIFEGLNEVKVMKYSLYFCSKEKLQTFLNLLPQFFAFGYDWTHCPKSSEIPRQFQC